MSWPSDIGGAIRCIRSMSRRSWTNSQR
jgi:hypothetical protein